MRIFANRTGFRLLLVAAVSLAPRMAHGAVVKEVQSGTAVSSANGIVSVTIRGVDPSKSFLIFTTRSNTNTPQGSVVRGRIPTACSNPCTTIEFERVTNEGVPATINISWSVATFSSGVFVQRGETVGGLQALTTNITITSVGSVAQAFVLSSSTPFAGETTWDTNDFILAELTTATNLQIRTDGFAGNHVVAWQVVQWTTAAEINVQKGSVTTLTGATLTVTATLGASYVTDKTFVLAAVRMTTLATPNDVHIGAHMVRAILTGASCPNNCPLTSNQIIVDRATAGAPNQSIAEVFYQVVELKDNSSVVRPVAAANADMQIASSATTKVVALQQEVDPNHSVAFASVQAAGGQNCGRTTYVTDDYLGAACGTTTLTKPTEITLQRDFAPANTAEISWFVVQFDAGPGSGFKTGSFLKPTNNSVNSYKFAHGLGETPKALIVWTAGKTNETFSGWYLFGWGMTDGTTSRTVAASSNDGVTTPNAARRVSDKLLAVIDATDTTAAQEMTFVSWDATHVTVNWTMFTGTQYVIHFMVIGGSSVQAKVVGWTMPTAPGDKIVNTVGFQPDVVLHAHAGDTFTGAINTSTVHSAFGLGVMDAAGNQWAVAQHTVDRTTVGNTDTQRTQRASDDGSAAPYSAFRAIDAALAITKDGRFKTMDAAGFTMTFGTANANAGQAISLALKGVTVKVMSFLKPAASGGGPPYTVDQPIALGFQPAAVLFASDMTDSQTAAQTNNRFGLGAADGISEGSFAFSDGDAQATAIVNGVDRTSKSFVKFNKTQTTATPPTIDAEADMYSFDTNGYTLRWTIYSPDTAPVGTQILSLAFAPVNVTAVTMTSMGATRYDRGVLTEWRTGDEVNNLGFHVYREINGERTAATHAIIAGSGLMTGPGAAPRGERHYAFWDLDPAAQNRTAVYFIQDVDFNGTSTWHGPMTPVEGGLQVPPNVASSGSLRDVNKESRRHSKMLRVAGTQLEGRWTAKRTPPPSTQLEMQWALAAQPAVKIGVTHPGWYRVTQPELVAAGLDARVNPRTLRLYAEGIERAIVVTGEGDGRFDASDAIEFYGTGLDTPSTDTRVYWLVAGTSPARRIAVRDNSARGDRSSQNVSWGAQSFWYTVQQKERSIFFAALKNGEAENWFGQVVSVDPIDIDIAVPHLDRAAASPAQLEITLQGVNAGTAASDHRVGVMVNDAEVGEIVFTGQALATQRFTVRVAALADGPNVVRLVARGGEEDYSLVDTVRLSYWHTYEADADVVAATADAPRPVTIGGFVSRAVRLVDITDPTGVEEIRGSLGTDRNGLTSISAQLTGSDVRTLFGFTDATIASPAYVRANRPSSWHATAAGYEYLAITHSLFAQSATALADRRRQQGLTAAVVDVEDIYDEFNFGEKTPQALKDFVNRAHTTGKRALRFVVLLGDATIDPRDYSGFGDADFVPTAQVPMAQVSLETASDDWFADADDDGVPELAVGRLSVRTAVQAQEIIAKIVGYETSNDTSWIKNVLLVADENDAVSNFEQSSRALRSLVPAGYDVKDVFRGALGPDETHWELLDQVNRGQLIVNYTGHGSMRVWGHDAALLTADDVRDLWRNNARLPFVVAMNCLNGFFHDIYDEESLGETFLRAPQGGAIAAWASSALTQPGPQAQVNQELFRLLFTRAELTIGEAVAAAKRVITDSDVRRSWILFGDPAMRLRGIAPNAPPVTYASPATAAGVTSIAFNGAASTDGEQNATAALGDQDVHLSDFTGDGRDDVWLYAPETGWQVFAARLNDDAAADLFFYRRETGDWVSGINVGAAGRQFTYRSGRWMPNLQILVGDLNDDGRDDLIAYDAPTGAAILATADASGVLVERRITWPLGARLHAGDVNGDGLRDVVGYDTRTGRGFVALSGKRDFTVVETQWGAGWQAMVADLNDDWRSDVVFYNPVTGAARLALSDSRGGFKFENRSWVSGMALHAASFTADARQGLFGYNAETGAWFTGSWSARGWAEQSGAWLPGSQIAIADLDGNGVDDVVSYDPVTGLGSRCYTVSPGVFTCRPDSWQAGRMFIGQPR